MRTLTQLLYSLARSVIALLCHLLTDPLVYSNMTYCKLHLAAAKPYEYLYKLYMRELLIC